MEDVAIGPEKVYVRTGEGPVLTARYAVYATGYEMPTAVRPTGHTVHSTYAMATQPQSGEAVAGPLPYLGSGDPVSVRRTTPDGRVICGGEDEEFQDEENADALLAHKTARLKKLAGYFQLDCHAAFAWCGSFGASPTGLPTIGAIPDRPGCFAIMAFGGNGITYSRIAAEVITAQITGRHDVDADLFALT